MLFDLILDDQHPANPHHRGLFELTRTITVLVRRRRATESVFCVFSASTSLAENVVFL